MHCLNPIHLKIDDSIKERVVPCGKCNACLVRSRMEWACRLEYEDRQAKSSFFVTLSYDNDHLPVVEYVEPDTGACFYNGVVSKRDIQLFMKRLRKELDSLGCKLRYYLISEYGPQTLRPHYHGLFFLDSVVDHDSFHRACCSAWPLCRPERLTVDAVTAERIKYCTEYALTKNSIPSYLEPNFRLMSRRPGIGASYVDLMGKWHKSERFFTYMNDNHVITLPRYYREKLYDHETLENRAADLEKQAFDRETAMRSDAGFDEETYQRNKRVAIADYNRVTDFLLNKKLKKKRL